MMMITNNNNDGDDDEKRSSNNNLQNTHIMCLYCLFAAPHSPWR